MKKTINIKEAIAKNKYELAGLLVGWWFAGPIGGGIGAGLVHVLKNKIIIIE